MINKKLHKYVEYHWLKNFNPFLYRIIKNDLNMLSNIIISNPFSKSPSILCSDHGAIIVFSTIGTEFTDSHNKIYKMEYSIDKSKYILTDMFGSKHTLDKFVYDYHREYELEILILENMAHSYIKYMQEFLGVHPITQHKMNIVKAHDLRIPIWWRFKCDNLWFPKNFDNNFAFSTCYYYIEEDVSNIPINKDTQYKMDLIHAADAGMGIEVSYYTDLWERLTPPISAEISWTFYENVKYRIIND